MDRQIEHVNQELDQFLHLFVNEWQDDWYDLLPITEFQHNNYVHSATQQPPFLLDTGQIPHIGFEPSQVPSELETVNEFMERMKSATEEAKSAIRKAQENMTWYYNQKRTPAPMYKPGDWVYLDTSDIKTTRLSPKLSHRWLGPFEIESQVGPSTYCKGTSRVVLSKFWGSVLSVAQWQIMYCTPTISESSLSVSCSAMPSNL